MYIMHNMKRTNIYLSEQQLAKLRKLCEETGLSLAEVVRRAIGFERISRRHQPPYAIELETLDRKQTDGAMGQMRRIERASQEADAHAVDIGREGGREGGQG